MLENLKKYLRTADWLDSKIPFMLSIALFLYVFSNENLQESELYLKLVAFFLYTSMFLAFSYVINDFTDIDVDIKAGKQKVMHKLSKTLVVISMIVIVLVGVIPMLLLVENKVIYIGYSLFLYLTGAAYSVHWLFRFKERGVAGLIECSVAQKCLPLVPLVFVFNVNWHYIVLFMIISFVNGLRYILIHQAVDYENDLKSGVKTYVSEGHNKYKSAIIAAFIIECILMLLLFAKLGQTYYFVFAVLVAYCVSEKIISTVVMKYMNVDWFCTFLAVPLELLYNVVFPILMAIVITIQSRVMVGVLVFLIILTAKCFKGKMAFINVYVKSKLRQG